MTKKVLVVSGSDRKGSFNTQLAEQLVTVLRAKGVHAHVYDYSAVPVLSQNTEFPTPAVIETLRKDFEEADGYLFVSPEYNGSYSARLKNLIDWLSRSVVAGDHDTPTVINGKPTAVASAANSTYGKFVRKNVNELLAYVRTRPLDHEGLGIRIPASAWGTGVLELDVEQQAALDAFATEFVHYVNQ